MTRSEPLYLPARLMEALLRLARREAPQEVVGLLAGTANSARRLLALPNVSSTPRTRFFAEPQALVAALTTIEARGEAVVALYHSHPHGPALPSPRDLAEACYDVPNLIVLPGPAVVRAFDLAATGWRARDLIVEGSGSRGARANETPGTAATVR